MLMRLQELCKACRFLFYFILFYFILFYFGTKKWQNSCTVLVQEFCCNLLYFILLQKGEPLKTGKEETQLVQR